MESQKESTSYINEVLSLPPTGHPGRAAGLQALGDAYAEAYERLGDLADIEKSVMLYQEALELTPSDDPDRIGRLQDLASSYLDRFERTETIGDLEKAIQLYMQALDATAMDHPDRPQQLENLGRAYQNQYEVTGVATYLEEGIRHLEDALSSTQINHPDRSERLQSLGAAYGTKYQRTGSIQDLDTAVQHLQTAFDTMPSEHPDMPELLRNLGITYHDRFQISGAIADLERSTQLDLEALAKTRPGDPCRANILASLGVDYREKYQITDQLEDFEQSMQYRQEALNVTPTDHPELADRQHSLAVIYYEKFLITGSTQDLEQAVEFNKTALAETLPSHPKRPDRLSSLGLDYLGRYRRTGASADLEQSIQCFQSALDSTPVDHQDRANRLQDLAMGYGDRYQRTYDLEDLEQSINLVQEALNLTPEHHAVDRIHRLQAIAVGYRDRHLRTGEINDFDQYSNLVREVFDATPHGHVNKPKRFKELGTCYRDRYRKSDQIEDLNEAIRLFNEAVDRLPLGHPSIADHLNDLGRAYQEKYEKTGSQDARELAVRGFQRALDHSPSPMKDRLRGAMALIMLHATEQRWQVAYEAASATLPLIPLLTPQALDNSDKQHLLLDVVNLASDAAAIALQAGKGAFKAIELVELGRGVIAGSLTDLRQDALDLRTLYPDLAAEYEHLRRQLDVPSSSTQPEMDERYKADQKLQTLILEIRDKPGFDRFLLALSEDELKMAAEPGPLVIVNVSSYRCDALIICQNRLSVIKLESLQLKDILHHSKAAVTCETLEWLWRTLAKPVLEELGITDTEAADEDCWPHIWWIPTGLLCRLPIHAAGYHFNAGSSILDRAVSSYGTSVKAVVHSRQNADEDNKQVWSVSDSTKKKVVLVGMQKTPMQSVLNFALDEVLQLEQLFQSAGIQPSRPITTHSEILNSLLDCGIFHFAGHGLTDAYNPARSSLLLDDWLTNPLTVANLLDTNLHTRRPFLSFLSACGTGRVNRNEYLDEGLHLIGACQLAGFRNVIGTLWEVDDSSCVVLAIDTYKWIFEKGWSPGSVGEGLHYATKKLRRQWLEENSAAVHRFHDSEVNVQVNSRTRTNTVETYLPNAGGMRHVELCSDEKPNLLHWVPYVHYGG